MAMGKRKKSGPRKSRGGRKPYATTEGTRKQVRVLKASGMPDLSIAASLGISVPTLTKHYRKQLDFGRAETIAELTMKRYEVAMTGNVSALNRVIEQFSGVLPTDERREDEQQEAPVPKPPKLGKKEQRRIDAESAIADTDWSQLLRQ